MFDSPDSWRGFRVLAKSHSAVTPVGGVIGTASQLFFTTIFRLQRTPKQKNGRRKKDVYG